MNKITLYLKSEDVPIGDVFGLINIWEENGYQYGEYFLARENHQEKIHKFRASIKIEDAESVKFDIENYVYNRMCSTHRAENLNPEMLKLKNFDFNPYQYDRFKWHNYSEDQMYFFLEPYKQFFDTTLMFTKSIQLQNTINKYRNIQDMITIENYD